jgi:hypothetical protein
MKTFIHNIDHSPHCAFVENFLPLQRERVEKIEGEGRVMVKKVNEN